MAPDETNVMEGVSRHEEIDCTRFRGLDYAPAKYVRIWWLEINWPFRTLYPCRNTGSWGQNRCFGNVVCVRILWVVMKKHPLYSITILWTLPTRL